MARPISASVLLAGISLILCSNGYAAARPLQEVEAAASNLKFEMPRSAALTEEAREPDGVETMAYALNVTASQLFDIVRNGVTSTGRSCPPAPLAQCTKWIESQSAMRKMKAEFDISHGVPVSYSCAEIGDFASKVYSARAAKQPIGEALNTISRASKDNPDKATLLQGIAIAIYADGSLDRQRAFEAAFTVCQRWPQPAMR